MLITVNPAAEEAADKPLMPAAPPENRATKEH
jgi:hypothetical protein